jgi:hypothetical protein
MWKPEHRLAADRRGLRYPSDLTDAEWGIVARKTALWLPGMPRLCIAATISSSVKSGCLAISASRNSACFSSGEVLPPLDFAATLSVVSKRCAQITTPLGLIP